MKRILKISSVVITIIWISFFIISSVAKYNYSDPSLEPMDEALNKMVYNVFIYSSIYGIINSVLTSVCLFSIFSFNGLENRIFGKIFLSTLGVVNLSFYGVMILLFPVNKDWLIIFPIIWVICAIACVAMLLTLGVMKEQKSINLPSIRT